MINMQFFLKNIFHAFPGVVVKKTLLCGLAAIFSFSMFACQGGFSEKTPINLNPNMDAQPKREAQSESLTPPVQTVPFGNAGNVAKNLPKDNNKLLESAEYSYGVEGDGASAITPKSMEEIRKVTQGVEVDVGVFQSELRYVAFAPLVVSKETMLRGQDRFNVFCSACHDRAGTGLGLVVQRRIGIPQPTDLAETRIREMQDGELFNIITHGRRNMQGYTAQISVKDRWAIVGYVRALQLSRNASENELPTEVLERLKKELQQKEVPQPAAFLQPTKNNIKNKAKVNAVASRR